METLLPPTLPGKPPHPCPDGPQLTLSLPPSRLGSCTGVKCCEDGGWGVVLGAWLPFHPWRPTQCQAGRESTLSPFPAFFFFHEINRCLNPNKKSKKPFLSPLPHPHCPPAQYLGQGSRSLSPTPLTHMVPAPPLVHTVPGSGRQVTPTGSARTRWSHSSAGARTGGLAVPGWR